MHSPVIFGAILAGAVMIAVACEAANPVAPQATELMTTPLTNDASREVRILNLVLPPGGDSGPEYHHGDQYLAVQEGEIQVAIEGKGEQTFKAGQAVHIDPLVVHRIQNRSDKPARLTELLVVDKGKPLVEPPGPKDKGSPR